MSSADGYEHVTDPGEPFEPTKRHTRKQREAEAIRDAAARIAADAPPLSPETIARVAALLRVKTPPAELMRWRLRLFRGHEQIRSAHHTHKTVHSAFTGSARCAECGLDPATIVAAEALGRLEAPTTVEARGAQALEREIKRHEREVERHQRELRRLRARRGES